MKNNAIEEVVSDSTFKERVMAVLANAPLNLLSNKEMMWAASNLPDGKKKGEFNTSMSFSGDVKHEEENIYRAFSISEKDLTTFAEIMRDAVKNQSTLPEGQQQNSRAIDHVLQKIGNDPKFVTSLVIKVMNDAADMAHRRAGGITGGVIGMGGIGDLLKLLKKLSDGKNPGDLSDLLGDRPDKD